MTTCIAAEDLQCCWCLVVSTCLPTLQRRKSFYTCQNYSCEWVYCAHVEYAAGLESVVEVTGLDTHRADTSWWVCCTYTYSGVQVAVCMCVHLGTASTCTPVARRVSWLSRWSASQTTTTGWLELNRCSSNLNMSRDRDVTGTWPCDVTLLCWNSRLLLHIILTMYSLMWFWCNLLSIFISSYQTWVLVRCIDACSC